MTIKLLSPLINPLPISDAHVVPWTLRKPIGIYMGDLILDVTLQYILCFFGLFLMVGKGLRLP